MIVAPIMMNNECEAIPDGSLDNCNRIPDHITYLMSRCKSRSKSNSESSNFKVTIEKCLMKLDSIDEVSWLLKALEFSDFLHLIFDLDKCLVGPCDEAQGYFWPEKGELVIAAGKMESEREAFLGTFAHELAHWAITLVFENAGLPYKRECRTEKDCYREILSEIAKETERLDDRFKAVFQCYNKPRWEIELIVVIPHLLAQRPTELNWPTEWSKRSFDFFKISVLPNIKTFVDEGPTKFPQRKTIAELNKQIGIHKIYCESDIKFDSGYNDSPVLVIGSDHKTVSLFKVLRNFGNNQNILCCSYYDIMDTLGKKIFDCFKKLDECRALVIIIMKDEEESSYDKDLRSFFNIVKSNPSKRLVLIVSCHKFQSTQNTLKQGNETFAFLNMKCIKDNSTIEQLTESSRDNLLKELVTFRGMYVKLTDLLSLRERASLIGGILIEMLLNKEEISIGSDCSRGISYDPDFIPCDQLIDEHNLVRVVLNCEKRAGTAVIIEAEALRWKLDFPMSLQKELCRIMEADDISPYFLVSTEELKTEIQSLYGREHSFVPIVMVQFQVEQSYSPYLRCLQQYSSCSIAYWIHVKPDKIMNCRGIYCPNLTFNRRLLSYNEDSASSGIDAQKFIDTEVLPRNKKAATVLCDKAGTGKSWFLNALFGKLLDTHWVVKIMLKFAKESIDALPSADLTDEHVIRFIKHHVRIDNEFAERFLKYKLRNESKYRLLLFFDGMEEIPWTETGSLQQNSDKIALLIRYLAEETCVQTITASRPENKDWLTNFPCRLYKFKSLDSCHLYIKTVCKARVELCGKDVTPHFFHTTILNYIGMAKQLLDTPLHVNMLVEIITEDIQNLREYNNLNSVATLYKSFVDMKFRNYMKKQNVLPDLRKELHKTLRGIIQKTAVFSMFGHKSAFKSFLEKSELFENRSGKLRLSTEVSIFLDIGLLTKHPSPEIEVQFIHQTLPEYLVSELILSWIQDDTQEQYNQLVVEGVLCGPGVYFGMLNDMLKHVTVPDKQISRYAAIMKSRNILDILKAIDRLAELKCENMLGLYAKCIKHSPGLLKLISTEYFSERVLNHSSIMYLYPLLPISKFCSDNIIEMYVELGFDVNHKGPDGRSIMHNLVKRGELDIVKMLVQRSKCQIDVVDHDGISLIHEAASIGNLELIKWLHKTIQNTKEPCLLKLCKKGKPAVIYAIEYYHWDVAMWILNEIPNDEKLQNYINLLFHAVCDKGREDILQNLLNGPWRDGVDKPDLSGLTPLHLAFERGHLNIAKLLVGAGAKVMARSNDGSSSLHYAARCRDPVLIKWCLEISRGEKCHFINSTDSAQRTPLHISGEAGRFESVKLLVEAGADMSLKSKHGLSFIHHTVMSGDHLIVEWVIEQTRNKEWFDVNCTTTELKTPILLAAELGHLKIICALINANGDVQRRSKSRFSIVHYAVLSNSFEVVEWCLQNVPEELIDSRDKEGKTPIHLAAGLGLHQIVRALKEAGGNLTLLSNDDASVLHYVADRGQPPLMKWCLDVLKESGFDVNHCDKHRRTPLDIASGKDDRRTMNLLVDYGGQRSYQHIVDALDEKKVNFVSGYTAIGESSLEDYFPGSKVVQRSFSPLCSKVCTQGENSRKYEDHKVDQSSTEGNRIVSTSTRCSRLGSPQRSSTSEIKSDSQIRSPNLSKESYLYLAVKQDNVGLVQTIVMTKDDTFYADDEGRTPLHLAVDKKNVGMVQLIASYCPGKTMEAYFNCKDHKGRTPLHRAVELGEHGIAHIIVLHGSSLPKEHFDLNSVDSNGKTPFRLSIEYGHQDIQCLLSGFGGQ